MENQNTKVSDDIYLIVLQELLIAQDLGLLLGDLRPGAPVVHAASLDRALEGVPDGARVAAAFVAAAPSQFKRAPLAARITQGGGHVVFVGRDPVDVAADEPAVRWSALPYPFRTDDVIAILEPQA